MKLENVTIGMRVHVFDPALLDAGTERCVVYDISKEQRLWPISIEMHNTSGMVTRGYVAPYEIEPYAEPENVDVEGNAFAADVLVCGLVQAAGYDVTTLIPIAYNKEIGELGYKAIEAILALMNAIDGELHNCFDEIVNNES